MPVRIYQEALSQAFLRKDTAGTLIFKPNCLAGRYIFEVFYSVRINMMNQRLKFQPLPTQRRWENAGDEYPLLLYKEGRVGDGQTVQIQSNIATQLLCPYLLPHLHFQDLHALSFPLGCQATLLPDLLSVKCRHKYFVIYF